MPTDEERGYPEHVLDAAFGPDAKPVPRWLAGLIARYGQPVTYQPEPIRLGACRYQTWAWVGFGVQVEQTLGAYSVRAHRKGRYAKLAGLKDYPTDAEISWAVAGAGLDDAPGRSCHTKVEHREVPPRSLFPQDDRTADEATP